MILAIWHQDLTLHKFCQLVKIAGISVYHLEVIRMALALFRSHWIVSHAFNLGKVGRFKNFGAWHS